MPEAHFGSDPFATEIETSERPSDSALLGLSWLITLRWWALVGNGAALILIRVIADVTFPVVPLFVLFGIAAISNLALHFLSAKPVNVRPALIGSVLLTDTVILSLILYFSGGPSNPLSIMYLVHITLAAVVLGAAWTWLTAVSAIICYGVLYYGHVPWTQQHQLHTHDHFAFHLQGMWIAFVVAALLTTYFLSTICRALRQSRIELEQLRVRKLKEERLASLTNLAAGAIHELATPLGTIALISDDLLEYVNQAEVDLTLRDDAQLLRREVSRCSVILEEISSRAGTLKGELPAWITAPELRGALEDALMDSMRARLRVVNKLSDDACFYIPLRGLAQSLAALIKNGVEACPETEPVTLTLAQDEKGYSFSVVDSGPGFPSIVLDQLGEPFVTTKPSGEGMGLGLFLAKLFAERYGGSLEVITTQQGATTVRITLPHRVSHRDAA